MFLLIAVPLSAEIQGLSSGEKTADALIKTGSGYFLGIIVMPDGTNDVTISSYDNTAGSGTEFLPTLLIPGDGGPYVLMMPSALEVRNGIYIDITLGAGTVAYAIITN